MLTCASHKHKDLYGKSKRIRECVCKEVYMDVILLGDRANWLRYHHGHFGYQNNLYWQTGQSEMLLVLCKLPHQSNPRIS